MTTIFKAVATMVATAVVVVSCVKVTPPAPSVVWSVTNGVDYDGASGYVQTIKLCNLPDSAARVAFNMFARQMRTVDPADTLIEIVPGYYAIGSPKIVNADPRDTVTIEILTRGVLRSICYAPDGFHGVSVGGKTFDLPFTLCDLLDDAVALSYAPDAEDIYRRNEELASASHGVYDVVPSFKTVISLGDSTDVDMGNIEFKQTSYVRGTESYNIVIRKGKVVVSADSAQWNRLQMRLQHYFGTGEVRLPQACIYDSPDMPYRGLMIDVARNFQPAEEIHKVLDLMALYGLNTLHFHLTDDEAWRFEVSALPELTRVGSRRGYTEGENGDRLPQLFAGNGDPDNTAGTANGYYTRAQMVDILRHAKRLAINVIPEIESPGHARAAIVSLRDNVRYCLVEQGDTSVYTSAQAFHDNVMNPALPQTYEFLETVFDELASIYEQAEMPLAAIHIGGDEVPADAWNGSDAVCALKDSLGLADNKAVHAYFVSRIADMLADRGIKVSGWQEIALHHTREYNRHLRPNVYSVNCWSTIGAAGASVVTDVITAGFPAILSNVDHFYLDQCYSPHPDERGLSWGGYVDEFAALHGYPKDLVRGLHPKGIQGQLFAETIRSQAGLETMLLPKMLGMAERAWNARQTYTDAEFNAIVANEFAKWAQQGLCYHVRQPGMSLNGKMLTVNKTYPDAELYITIDGTTPTKASIQVTPETPILIVEGVSQVRAVQYVGNVASVATVLNIADK